jgi:hypothetical protein
MCDIIELVQYMLLVELQLWASPRFLYYDSTGSLNLIAFNSVMWHFSSGVNIPSLLQAGIHFLFKLPKV